MMLKSLKRQTHGFIPSSPAPAPSFTSSWGDFLLAVVGEGARISNLVYGWKLPFAYHTAKAGNHTAAHKQNGGEKKKKKCEGKVPSDKKAELGFKA